MNDSFIELIDDEHVEELHLDEEPWKVAIIDDEHDMHEVTRLALADIRILGKPLTFLSAYTAKEGKELLIEHSDIAVVLLDVVMESHDAGLKLAAQIRQELQNHNIQIILRTGQPGYAPEEEIIQQFEINDYKTKNELSRSKLLTSISTAIRSYHQLTALENSKVGLEGIIKASANLFKERSIEKFSQAVLLQINALFSIDSQGMFCVSHKPATKKLYWQCSEQEGYFVVAATDKFNRYYGKKIDALSSEKDQEVELVAQALKQKEHIFTGNLTCFYLSTPSGWQGAIVFDKTISLEQIDQELLAIFCVNVSLGLENAKFYSHLNEAAFKDKLTGLLSRTGLIESLPSNVAANHCYLQVVDIDYFRDITENLGYEFGDKVLIAFAQYLQVNFGDKAIISRLHADVFALLFMADVPKDDSEYYILTNSIKVNDSYLRIGTSTGCSTYNPENSVPFDVELMLRQAEMAMKVAKEEHRGFSKTFSTDIEGESKQRLMLLNDLRIAISNDDLFIQLQPKVDITDNSIIGYEALIRWLDPKKGMISPGVFVPIAEKSGLYFDLDVYVFSKCLTILEQQPEITKPVSINISAHSLSHNDLVATLSQKMSESSVDISRVEIEVTENALVRGDVAIDNLKAFKESGFTLCLDDFGSGYSSLSYLLKLPFDVIKIDRSFIVSIDSDERSIIVLKSIVEMTEQLGKSIIVEGVEESHQVEMLRSLGANYIQGFYFYKPMIVSDIIDKSIL